MTASQKWRRRAMLAGGLAAVVAWVRLAPQLPQILGPGAGYEPIPGLPPFRRRIGAGSASMPPADPMLVGLDAATNQGWRDHMPAIKADPCATLFIPGPGVPVAFFTDFNCPYCRQMERVLDDHTRANAASITVTRHELPLLGPNSERAARALLAARLQQGGAAMQARLDRTRGTGDMAAVARSMGLDGARLLRDMQGPEVQRALDRDYALAMLFGFFGTPGTVIGRTVISGALSGSVVAGLVEDEAKDLPMVCQPLG